ncbi:hypothetical protein [Tenuifilum thalassicum]|uniref:Heparinase II/III-like C-terminal domain-containing protein n=1 Tax=Tenuifilum thalassicum TaxID=2590900 RepID=A0A7D3XLA1_9BACT|nr:hypothetical protein [Tenuifilum thalassicum]QKG80230.1 hypothetical protein FHG85_08135 [Tenuifilum thalassicum]
MDKTCITQVEEYDDRFEFVGEIKGFPLLGRNIVHKRKVIKYRDKPLWRIIDQTNYKGKDPIILHWNINPNFKHLIDIKAKDSFGNNLKFEKEQGWYSELYGVKENFDQFICNLNGNNCETIIQIR